MHISLVGVNHEKTPVAIREKVSIGSERLPEALSRLRHHLPGGIVLSTCNRTEVYTADGDSRQAEKASFNFLRAQSDVPEVVLLQHVYVLKDEAVVEHLFRVAGGLDSMIIGEFEILGQIGQALQAAEKAKVVNLPLRFVFQSAIRAGRRVREETGISQNALSVSSVAVDLAARIVGDLLNGKMLVIGTGEAGQLVVKVARERGVHRIAVASRTQERTQTLAEALGGTPTDLKNLAAELSTCNIVVACAGAPRQILDVHRVKTALKTRPESPLVIIDIAVPRNVEPAVGKIDNVFLYNIDDLTQISDLNREQREKEVQKATEIIAAEVDKFASRWRAFEVRPLVTALMRKAEDIRCEQLSRTLKKLPPLSDEERDNLEAMTKSIVTKILQDPIRSLKAEVNSIDYAEMVSELFHLDGKKQE
jgi:glutamyl-tRNA reductase